MIDEPKIIRTTAHQAAVVRLEVPRSEIEKQVEPAIREIMTVLAEQGMSPKGPLFTHHITQSSETFDIEVGFPVNGAIEPNGRVRPGTLPGGLVAFTLYRGNYHGLFEAWKTFGIRSRPYLNRAGLTHGATLWESYVVGPESEANPDNWKTELYQALKKLP